MLKKFQTAFRLQKSFLRHLCRLAGLGGDHQKRLILLETKLLKWHVKWNCWKLWTWKIRTEMGYHMVPWCKNMEYLTWRICWSVTQERKVAQCMAQCMAQGRSKRTRAGSHRPGSLPARVSLQCPPRALVCPNPCTTITDQKQKAASLKFNFLQWRNTKTSNFPESSLQIDKAVNIAIRAKKENVKEVMSAYHVALCCCLRIYTCLGPCVTDYCCAEHGRTNLWAILRHLSNHPTLNPSWDSDWHRAKMMKQCGSQVTGIVGIPRIFLWRCDEQQLSSGKTKNGRTSGAKSDGNALNPYPKLSNTWDWSKLNRRGCPAKWFCPDHAFGCLPMKKTSSEVQLWTWQGTFFHTVSDTCLCFVLSSHLHHHMSSLSALQFTLGVDESLMMLILNTLPSVQCPKWASEVHRFALLTVTSLTPQGPACLPSTSRFPATFEPWHVAQSKPSALTAAARLGKAKLRRKLVTSRASRGWSNSPESRWK